MDSLLGVLFLCLHKCWLITGVGEIPSMKPFFPTLEIHGSPPSFAGDDG